MKLLRHLITITQTTFMPFGFSSLGNTVIGKFQISNAASASDILGTVVISDTERFIGYHAEKYNGTKDQVTQVSSNVASLGGNVNLKAGEKYTQVASNVMAANDIDITAKSLDILTADNTGTQHVDDKSLKIGVFARVQSPLIDLVNNVDAARQSDGRLKGLQNMAAAANGVQALAGAAGQTGYLVRAEAGIGVASAQSRNDATYSTSQSSAINGGHNVNLTSTEGDIHTVAANIGAGQTLSLDSARDILLESGQSTSTSSGKNSNYGVEIGIGAEIGQKTGAYIYGQAQFGKGKYNTESISQTNTHLQAQTLNISSNGNTTLHGADAQADTINADVGGKLLIESVQDTAEQHSKESGGKVRVTYGTNGLNGELNYNQTKANGSYEGVNQQSGLFAGQGGYHVQSDSTELIGGALTSTNPTRSELTTGALSFKDIENKSTYATSSTGINLSTRSSMAGNIVNNLGNIVNMVGSGKPTEEASITKATLTEGNINIGGQQTSAASTGINTDDNTAHKALENLPDLRALMAEQQAEAAAISTISQGVTIVVNNAISYGQGVAIDKLKQADQALLDAQTSGDSTVIKTAEQNKAAAVSNVNHWGKDGLYTIAANAVGQVAIGLAADKDPKAIAAAIAAPMVANAIGDRIGTNNPAAKFAAHAVTAGIVAALNGADTKEALAAGLATGLTEAVIIPAVSDALFGTHDPMLLTSDQKQELLAISGVSGAIVAGLVGDSATAAGFGVSGSLNAVANNYLTRHENDVFTSKLNSCTVRSARGVPCTAQEKQDLIDYYTKVSKAHDVELIDACKANPTSTTCVTDIKASLDYSTFASRALGADVQRSNLIVLNTLFNSPNAEANFAKIVNDIDSRADFFDAMHRAFPTSKWFTVASQTSRGCIVGLGADGCGSWASFGVGNILTSKDLYGWRSDAGSALMVGGFDNFKSLFDNGSNNIAAWDIQQLKEEQLLLQPIHKKYLGSDFITTPILVPYVYPGVDLRSYADRIRYGCKNMGYTQTQGCTP